jgi:hypothetical protein
MAPHAHSLNLSGGLAKSQTLLEKDYCLNKKMADGSQPRRYALSVSHLVYLSGNRSLTRIFFMLDHDAYQQLDDAGDDDGFCFFLRGGS